MATAAQIRASEKYDSKNTMQIKLKLNLKTDADIIAQLEAVASKQGYIKELIRADINSQPFKHLHDLKPADMPAEARKIVSGDFIEGGKVTVNIDGKIAQRRVYYSAAAGDLYITVNNMRYFYCEFY